MREDLPLLLRPTRQVKGASRNHLVSEKSLNLSSLSCSEGRTVNWRVFCIWELPRSLKHEILSTNS